MKIVHLCTTDHGGAAKAAYRLHKGLQAIGLDSTMLVVEKKSNDISVVVLPSKRSYQQGERFSIICQHWQAALDNYPNRPAGLEMYSHTFSDVDFMQCKEILEADVINLHWIAGMFDYENAAQAFKGKKLVWTLHDMNPFTGGCHYAGNCTAYKNACGACPQLGSNVSNDLSRLVFETKANTYKQLDLTIVTPSKWLGSCSASSTLFGKFRHEVIPYGFPLNTFRPLDRMDIRQGLSVSEDTRVILFGADSVTNQRKGFLLLLQALVELSKINLQYKLVLAIFGSLDISVQIPCSFPVLTFNYVSDESDLATLYNLADLFVLPSLEDNLPNTVVESLACGTPVVAFDIGGLPDMVDHKQTGYLAACGDVAELVDGILWCINEAPEHIRDACREKAEKFFALEMQAYRYKQLYEANIEQIQLNFKSNLPRITMVTSSCNQAEYIESTLNQNHPNLESIVADNGITAPLFSVIIPTYNSYSVIRNAIDSVIKQTLPNLEIIIIDGSSTDNTVEIVESYNDERIKVFSEKDKGIYDAMNKGIRCASGKWLLFLGSDDVIFDNNTLKAVSSHLKSNSFYYGNVKVNGNTGWAQDGAIYDGEFTLQKLLLKNICHQSIFYNRDVIIKNAIEFKLEYPVCADWDFNLKCWSISPFTHIPLTIAIFNAGGVSTKKVVDRFYDNLLCHLTDYFNINSMPKLMELLPKERLYLLTKNNLADTNSLTRLIAIHLPQFHTIPENDEWWGKGFTEWTNVKKAKPLFDGHYQTHVPADLGYYDLSDPSSLKAQADLAEEYGIHGFCFYHYWFNGKLLLETPLHQMLNSGEPDFPFCLCWANEDWTRAWDGRSGEVLIGQNYSDIDDIRHFYYLLNFFEDKRYIRVNGKPLFLVYRASRLPDPLKTTNTWREIARKAGLGELYLCRVESCATEHSDPTVLGFDAAVEFQPDWHALGQRLERPEYGTHSVYDYPSVVVNMCKKPAVPYTRHPCVTPTWDNSARRKSEAVIFINSSPKVYQQWLNHAVNSVQHLPSEERLVFVNAWNEWGEGNHLEPDQRFGRAYLEATKTALLDITAYQDNQFVASIIIPVFNKIECTKNCIRSLINSISNITYEVIIVDNGSTDGTSDYLKNLKGDIKIINNQENVGYTIACNQGASVARGKHLVFINNDTLPHSQWLQHLITTAENDPKVGAVGTKLFYPNGTLQESGAIVAQDGSAMNSGRGDDPNRVLYNMVSEVDYCSGSYLLIPRQIFNKLGGFDKTNTPDYYEETDFCFRLREHGYKVIYQPLAQIIHCGSVTAGLGS